MRRSYLSGLLCAPLLACGGPREAVDVAQICLDDQMARSSTEMVLEVDAPLVVYATASAGCHTADLEVSCEAELDGDVVRVSALTTWVRTEPLATSCESIAFHTMATCETEPLPAGSYTLEYAGDAMPFEVPGPATGCVDP